MNATPQKTYAEGIYFDMPEDEYHALPMLSASGMKNLLISPTDFYYRSWMNVERDTEQEETDAMIIGRAYHKRILEGKEAFYRLYAAALDRADYPSALITTADLRTALAERGLKTSDNKDVLIARLLTDDPTIEIWDALVSAHARKNEGKILLPFKTMRRIEMAAAMIEGHPDLGRCIVGGYSEVSIFWHDEETGVPCKGRVDYLKTQAIVDLKSFSNALRKPLDAAVRSAMANYGYYVQAAMYWRAIERAVQFARLGRVFGEGDRGDWLKSFIRANPDERQFIFLFQNTGPAQVARGYVFPRGTVFGIGEVIARESLQIYRNCVDTFGDGPWVDLQPITAFDDVQFPAWLGQSS